MSFVVDAPPIRSNRTSRAALALLVTSTSCGARSGLDAPAVDARADAPVDAAAPIDAGVCSCRVCSGSCRNVPGCPGGLCRRGRCLPLCSSDGAPCAAGTSCNSTLDCDKPVMVCS